MAKNKTNQPKNRKKPMPKADLEFSSDNGLERKALMAQRNQVNK